MKVQEAIQTIETLGGYKFVRRYRHFNLDTNRTETAYVFEGERGEGWGPNATFDCLGQLRFYAKQFNYTHGVNR